jgi:hypothetical protein
MSGKLTLKFLNAGGIKQLKRTLSFRVLNIKADFQKVMLIVKILVTYNFIFIK